MGVYWAPLNVSYLFSNFTFLSPSLARLLLLSYLFTVLCVIGCEVKESDSDTIIMVIVLVAGVGGVFILFALMALCYR